MNTHQYAVVIEHVLEDIFHCNKGDVGGIVNSDAIDHVPYMAMMAGLSVIYKLDSTKRSEIDTFGAEYYNCLYKNLNDIERIESTEYIQKMIDDFENIVY